MKRLALLIAALALALGSGHAQAQINGSEDDLQECQTEEVPGTRGADCAAIGPVGQISGAGDARARSGVAQQLIERLRDEEEEPGGASADLGGGFGLFATGRLTFRDQDETARENASDTDRYGVILGLDYRTGPVVLGVAGDYTRGTTDFDGILEEGDPTRRVGRTRTHEFGIQGFGFYYPVPEAFVGGLARLGYNEYRIRRNLTDGSVSGKTDGFVFGLVGTAGYDFDVGRGVIVGLAASLDYERTRIDGYTESELPGGGRVRFDKDRITTLTSILELRLSRAYSTDFGVLVPHIAGRWLHEFKDDSRTIRFTGIDEFGDPASFGSFRTNRPDRDHANLEVGASGVFAGGWSGFVTYDVLLGHSFRDEHNVTLGIRREF